MNTLALTLVLTAAFLHALWNAMIKGSGDRILTLGLVNLGHIIIGGILVLKFPLPAEASWPFIIGSTFIHYFYYGFLLLAYRFGDLSEVYPIARGIAPVLVALGGFFIVGEALPLGGWLGIMLVSGGIGLLFVSRNHSTTNPKAIYAALLTGLTIASYSVVDGMGVRVAESPFGYIGWLFLLEGFSVLFLFYYRRKTLQCTTLKFIGTGLAGGVVSALAYGLAIYAATLATLASVSAVRESSVIIAALIGVIWFKERPWKIRVIAAIIVATGVIILATTGG